MRIGIAPTTPSSPSTIAPTTSPAVASASGGSPESSSALMRKYAAAPIIAPNAQATPVPDTVVDDDIRSRTRTSPTAQIATPTPVSPDGRCDRRTHSHSTTAAGEVNSMSKAGATCIDRTAEK
ncbi:hypothetical protein GCM10009773_27300 [Williamsia serinedens]